MITEILTPIRGRFYSDEQGPFAVVEWIGNNDYVDQILDAETDAETPYFLDGNTDLIIRQLPQGLIGEIIMNPDENGNSDEVYTIPFVVEDKADWPWGKLS